MGNGQSVRHDTNLVISTAVVGALSAARGEGWSVPWAAADRPNSDDASDVAWLLFAEALAAQTEMNLERALGLAVDATEKMHALSGTWDDFTHMWPTAVELALDAGDDAVLTRMLALVDVDAGGPVPPCVLTHRKRAAGLIAMRDGSPPELVESTMRSAITGFRDWGAVPHRARAEAELGTWLVGQGRADEAAPLIDSARAAFSDLGASAWLEQLQSQLTPAR